MTLSQELARLKEVCDKATAGPWGKACSTAGHYIEPHYDDPSVECVVEAMAACGPEHKEYEDDQYAKVIADSNFIAQSRTALPKLISALEATTEGLQLILMQRENYAEDAAENIYCLATEALAQI